MFYALLISPTFRFISFQFPTRIKFWTPKDEIHFILQTDKILHKAYDLNVFVLKLIFKQVFVYLWESLAWRSSVNFRPQHFWLNSNATCKKHENFHFHSSDVFIHVSNFYKQKIYSTKRKMKQKQIRTKDNNWMREKNKNWWWNDFLINWSLCWFVNYELKCILVQHKYCVLYLLANSWFQ